MFILSLTAVDVEPGEQGMHLVAPPPEEVFASHGEHNDAPSALKVPGEHG
jgi:hypothetical protein